MVQHPELPAHTVDVWYACVEDLVACDSYENHCRILSRKERERIERFALPRVRDESLAARLLVRHALSTYTDVRPVDWIFAEANRGKPFVKSPWPNFSSFNLAHSANLVVCAVAAEGEIGVDVESLDRSTTGIALAKRFFAAAEVEQLVRMPDYLQREFFLRIWTLKESYIKAIGDGLLMPLDQFFFDISQDGPARLHLIEGSEKAAGEWFFAQIGLPSRHHISLGMRNSETLQQGGKERIVCRLRKLDSVAGPPVDQIISGGGEGGLFFESAAD
ncbi:MAG: 4'-phosphopantetheinyl transferase superfamily protein [Pirellulales bacterium]|nr:4'-phosphopantetheinyl transferase superfamily protein [Pirellulales bacterium]